MLCGVRSEWNSINTSKHTAVQRSSYPLALAQCKPDLDLHDRHRTKSNISSLRMREPSPPRALLQKARSHCTYSQREMCILLCSPKTDPKQHKLDGCLRYKFWYLPLYHVKEHNHHWAVVAVFCYTNSSTCWSRNSEKNKTKIKQTLHLYVSLFILRPTSFCEQNTLQLTLHPNDKNCLNPTKHATNFGDKLQRSHVPPLQCSTGTPWLRCDREGLRYNPSNSAQTFGLGPAPCGIPLVLTENRGESPRTTTAGPNGAGGSGPSQLPPHTARGVHGWGPAPPHPLPPQAGPCPLRLAPIP